MKIEKVAPDVVPFKLWPRERIKQNAGNTTALSLNSANDMKSCPTKIQLSVVSHSVIYHRKYCI